MQPFSNPRAGSQAVGGGAARMDIDKLDRVVCSLYQTGLAPLHSEGIHGGKEAIFGFLFVAGATPLPAKEQGLCQFVAFLKMEGLRY